MIELDILWMDGEQMKLHDLGITDGIESSLMPVVFYEIASISKYEHEGRPCCIIASNGQEYIANKPFEEVKELISLQFKK
jgi:glycine cleavage system H lipoate-binding protein